MKKIAYLFLLLVLTACAGEDPITPAIEQPNEFTLTDNPSDPVQHARYLLFKEYGVPVYFNDTIAVRNKGTNADGSPRMIYETVDLNWTFSGYNRGVKYTYHYLTQPEEQLRALNFVGKYLATAPKALRPFSIMLADTLTASSRSSIEQPIYHVGFRTLVFAQVKDLTDPDTIQSKIATVIRNMIADRVTANKTVCALFAQVSSEKGWYKSEWEKLGNCPTLLKWQRKSWVLSPNALFDSAPYEIYGGQDLVDLLLQGSPSGEAYVADAAEAREVRRLMIQEMGNYGFIRGWKNTGFRTPADDKEDREYFLQAIITLGERGFRARYGTSKLVMEKYQILADFISDTLGYPLDYDGRSEEEQIDDITNS